MNIRSDSEMILNEYPMNVERLFTFSLQELQRIVIEYSTKIGKLKLKYHNRLITLNVSRIFTEYFNIPNLR